MDAEKPAGGLSRAWSWATRHKAWAAAGAVVAVVGAVEVFAYKIPQMTCDALERAGDRPAWCGPSEAAALAKQRAALAAAVAAELAAQTRASGAEGETLDGAADDAAGVAAAEEAVAQADDAETAALEQIAAGEVEAGLDALAARARDAETEAAARWRRLGALTRGVDVARASAAYEKAIALDGAEPWDAIHLGRLRIAAGDLDGAEAALAQAEAALGPDQQRLSMVLNTERGDVLRDQGDLDAALTEHRASMAIARALAEDDPRNATWRRDVAVSLWKLASLNGGGVAWADVVAALERMIGDGVLSPRDEGALEMARTRAAQD